MPTSARQISRIFGFSGPRVCRSGDFACPGGVEGDDNADVLVSGIALGENRPTRMFTAYDLRYRLVMSSTAHPSVVSAGGMILPDEDPDIVVEAAKIMKDPDHWLDTPNSAIGGHKPRDLVKDGREGVVRNVLRTLKYIGMS